VAALEDRGHLLVFEPSPAEVHLQAAQWFWDQEIFDVVADHLHLLGQHSLRTYTCAWELKRAGLDWRQGVLCRCLQGPALAVARLKTDPTFPSEAQRVRAFRAAGWGGRATYFRYAQQLRPTTNRPTILLRHTRPPVDGAASAGPGQRLPQRRTRAGNRQTLGPQPPVPPSPATIQGCRTPTTAGTVVPRPAHDGNRVARGQGVQALQGG
jgi:hypothetical protein